jgi:hypothetical protein
MDDLLIPLSNGWVCEKQRDGSAPGGYLTTYWSPEVSLEKRKSSVERPRVPEVVCVVICWDRTKSPLL